MQYVIEIDDEKIKEKTDAEAPDCLTPLKDVIIGRLAVEQELLDLLERWKGQGR